MSMRMQQTRQKLSRQNLPLDFATDNCDFICYCGSALISLCLRGCHQMGVKSSTGKKVFLVSLFASEGKTGEGKEFDPIHDHRVNGKSLFATFQARRSKKRCNRPHLASGCWHLAQCFHWFQRRGQLKFIRLVIPP